MKEILLLVVFALLLGSSVLQKNTDSEIVNESFISFSPDRVMLTIPGNPATSRAVTWRTNSNVSKSIGQIVKTTGSPFFEDQIINIEGYSTFWMEGDSSAMGHKVIFNELDPETMYTYRVGDGENWSEWFQFTTSSEENKPFDFIYLGDFQNDIKQFCSRVIRQSYSHFSNADFILFAGDLVSRSEENYWDEFFYAGSWIFGTMPSVATPGNHEYYPNDDGPRSFSKHWNQIFVNPKNNPDNLENRTYFIDYQGVRFVSLDSPAMGYGEENMKNSAAWLNKVLSENPNKWTILFTHYPVYSCSQGRNNESYREIIKPILEKYGVDLVLQGHDHTYCRGQNIENVGDSCKNPPMYVVSVSGPKMYGLNTSFWSDRMASSTQLYQNIAINENTIHVKTFTVAGELYDDFKLIKNSEGINSVIESEDVPKIDQRIEIPESAKKKYTDEELKRYKLEFY